MTRDEETRFLRDLQEATEGELRHHFELESYVKKDGITYVKFAVTKDLDSGYLHYRVAEDGHISWAEMNVNFPTLIGLNRSPLELRILCEHVHATWTFTDDPPDTLS